MKPNVVSLGLLALTILAVCSSNGSGSIARFEDKHPLQPLADWLRQTGKESVVRAPILEAMDLPPLDMPVRERGFRHEGERITHVCSIGTTPREQGLLLFAQVDESDGSAIVWRTGPNGVLISTVQFSGLTVRRVPNELFERGFTAEKVIFLIKAQAQSRP